MAQETGVAMKTLRRLTDNKLDTLAARHTFTRKRYSLKRWNAIALKIRIEQVRRIQKAMP